MLRTCTSVGSESVKITWETHTVQISSQPRKIKVLETRDTIFVPLVVEEVR